MTARGFCTCKRDHPGNVLCHPAPGASWHYLCDKPVLPPPAGCICGNADGCDYCPVHNARIMSDDPAVRRAQARPTGTGWPS